MRAHGLIERHFWMNTVFVVVACAGLAASATADVIAATLLAEPTESVRRPAARAPRPLLSWQPETGLGDRSALLVQRNIFCSECVPPPPPGVNAALPASDEPPLTSLPLRLIATTIGPAGTMPIATVRNTDTAQQGAVRLGEVIPGAGPITRILGAHVDFQNAANQRIERLSLLAPRPATRAPAPPPPPKRSPKKKKKQSARAELLAAIDAGVRKSGPNSFDIDRALLTKVLAHPVAASRGARVVPSVKNGRPNGFKLTRVRRSSIYAKIGFKRGDTIQAINGFELTSMDKALELYTKLREASHLSVSVTRRGKPLTLDYTIR